MNASKARRRLFPVFAAGLTALLLTTGCSALSGAKSSDTQTNSARKTQPANAPVYYDFGDVLLPRELKVDKDGSFIFNTPGLTAGVLTLTGRVESNSLITFFENRMPADGWRLISSIRSPRTKMLFHKEARWCVISIAEGQFSTVVEIWVSPTLAGADTGLTKP